MLCTNNGATDSGLHDLKMPFAIGGKKAPYNRNKFNFFT